ncbi:siderophore ABC transporter substrate-binding protein [Pelistega sp. NLN82]|uniref:Siderophore ABC transporter substrate-binding protein n=1 Tax=Pelistega ratti TaxID=2652177 RepID=A0A6L9Y4F8_9BURK|nr:siderophore ABC transporter substrate-binding protein [Pelistega ratti]
MNMKKSIVGITAILISVGLVACNKKEESIANTNTVNIPTIVIQHKLGDTSIKNIPQRVVALDMNEVDFLDRLAIPIAGMVKDFIPHFLRQYQGREDIQDLGAIVQPNLDRIYTLKPDLILITPLHSKHYQELSSLAPTIHYDIDYKTSENQFEMVKKHLEDLGGIFQKQDLAEKEIEKLDNKIKQVRQLIAKHPEKALIVLHNNGSFSNMSLSSRYGFIFKELGVKPASENTEVSLHGQPITSEFIYSANPDILYIIDRTAVMEKKAIINKEQVSNPLLKETIAWKNNRVIFVDADAWYTTAASPTSLSIMMDDVLKAYQ